MSECVVYGYETDTLHKCKSCGDMFCQECGDIKAKLCLFCLEDEDSDLSDDYEVEDYEENW